MTPRDRTLRIILLVVVAAVVLSLVLGTVTFPS
jgi:hypothetical protein